MPFHVKALKKEKKLITGYNRSIPQPENKAFRLAVCGMSGSGKSVLIVNLLREMRVFFKKIIIISPNPEQFAKHFAKYMTKHDQIIEKTTAEGCEAILTHHYEKLRQRNRKRPHRFTPTLFVMDDCLDLIQNSKIFERLMLESRKEGLSLMFACHRYAFTAPITRQNLTHLVLLSTTDLELRLVSQYLGMESKAILRAYRNSTADRKFNFLYFIINEGKMILNFSDKQLL